ncbi:hypothetical protein EGR_01745 [Echinococcus granulosus]|uniref:Uncharacterized protein n=1 Tax=Echinococcus granulosus TaxID=6210 RepID=W6V9F9_ECHGR|nr:hypothetical protein EGR_01745 [Echinococcus granulosus]EUB63254.1 hypothetical protein EGR_01745 [Echinococcus granulosus]
MSSASAWTFILLKVYSADNGCDILVRGTFHSAAQPYPSGFLPASREVEEGIACLRISHLHMDTIKSCQANLFIWYTAVDA